MGGYVAFHFTHWRGRVTTHYSLVLLARWRRERLQVGPTAMLAALPAAVGACVHLEEARLLARPQVRVQPSPHEQLLMRARLLDLAQGHGHHGVCARDRGQAMRDDERGAVHAQHVEGVLPAAGKKQGDTFGGHSRESVGGNSRGGANGDSRASAGKKWVGEQQGRRQGERWRDTGRGQTGGDSRGGANGDSRGSAGKSGWGNSRGGSGVCWLLGSSGPSHVWVTFFATHSNTPARWRPRPEPFSHSTHAWTASVPPITHA
eukprot:363658-Chlamydomonas_euryale.AAC.9